VRQRGRNRRTAIVRRCTVLARSAFLTTYAGSGAKPGLANERLCLSRFLKLLAPPNLDSQFAARMRWIPSRARAQWISPRVAGSGAFPAGFDPNIVEPSRRCFSSQLELRRS